MTDAATQTSSVEISSSLRMYDEHNERDDRFTTATTTMNIGERGSLTTMMPVSGNEEDEIQATSSSATTTSIVSELTAPIIPSSTPTSPSISSPSSVPTQFAEINISPPATDDRMIFNDIDISAQFYSFK